MNGNVRNEDLAIILRRLCFTSFSCQVIVIAIEFGPEEYRWASLTSNQLGADRLTTCLPYERSAFQEVGSLR